MNAENEGVEVDRAAEQRHSVSGSVSACTHFSPTKNAVESNSNTSAIVKCSHFFCAQNFANRFLRFFAFFVRLAVVRMREVDAIRCGRLNSVCAFDAALAKFSSRLGIRF